MPGLPNAPGLKSAIAIIAGTAASLFADLELALAVAPEAELVAVNRAALDLPVIAHATSIHARMLEVVRLARSEFDCVADPHCETYETHAYWPGAQVDRVWAGPGWNQGSSGLFAVRVALALGYERVILAGVPLDDSPRYHDTPLRPIDWPAGGASDRAAAREKYRAAWRELEPELRGRVSSASGWTRELLGAPA